MDLEYVADIEYPYHEAMAVPLEPSEDWVVGCETDIDPDGGRFVSDVGLERPGRRDMSHLRVGLDHKESTGSITIYGVTWTPTMDDGGFPIIDGELELVDVESGATRVILRMAYLPPPGAVSGALDRGMMFRIAWATLNDVLGRLSRGVGRELPYRGSPFSSVAYRDLVYQRVA